MVFSLGMLGFFPLLYLVAVWHEQSLLFAIVIPWLALVPLAGCKKLQQQGK